MAEFKLTFEDGSDGYLAQTELDPKEVERRRYAFPEERKFPLTDASKVMSAIKFFNYVDPKDERHLAEAILKRMEELGISEVNVGPTNRFKKYYEAQDGYLQHFGVKGMHWGVWNEDTRAKRNGGSRRTRIKTTPDLYRRALEDRMIRTDRAMRRDAELNNKLRTVHAYEKKHNLNFNDPNFSWSNRPKNVRKGYSKVYGKYSALEAKKRQRYAKRYQKEVYSEYVAKYGKTAFNKSKREYKLKGAAAVAKLSAIVLTAPVSVPVIIGMGLHEANQRHKAE